MVAAPRTTAISDEQRQALAGPGAYAWGLVVTRALPPMPSAAAQHAFKAPEASEQAMKVRS